MKHPINKNDDRMVEQLSFDSLLDEDNHSEKDNLNKMDGIIPTIKQNRKTFPLTLVIDFNEFMDYIEHHPVSLTKTAGHISTKHLPLINKRLSVIAEEATNHTTQQHYPYIHFFYHLALSGRLLKKDSLSSKLQLTITERWHMFKRLTNTEKYMFLLETFWIDLDLAKLLDKDDSYVHLILNDMLTKLMDEKSGHLLQLKDKEPMLANLILNWNFSLLYLEWFGLWICEKDQERIDHYGKKSYYFAKTISLTPFGKKIIPIFLNSRNMDVWNIALRRKNGEINPLPGSPFPEEDDEAIQGERMIVRNDQSSERFHEAFITLFPRKDLQTTLPRLERKFVHGVHTFKVSFDYNVWRKVILSAKHTMEDLHEIITKAYQFDDDHLYSFFMDGEKWSRDCIAAPLDSFGHANAAEVTIGSVGMFIGQQFLYLYDYGDEWTFTITLEKVEETEPEPMKPFIKEQKGDAPEQYFYME
jgi:hypothetical protein